MALLSKTAKLWIQLTLSVALLFAELIVGYMVNSIALIADAFHMLNDVVSLFIAVYAVKLANRKDYDPKYTYGWQRAEVLGALINAVLLLGLCITILAEAVPRFFNPVEIENPQLILIVGSMGLAFNVFGMFLFGGHGHAHGHGHDHGHSHGPVHDIESRVDSVNTAAEFQQSIIQEADTMRRKKKAQISEQSPLMESVQLSYDANEPNESAQHNHAEGEHNHSHSHDAHNAKHDHDHGHSHGHSHGEGAMNMYGVYLHVLGDALANIAVIATALIIWLCDFKEKFLFDPIISILITLLIIKFTIPLIKSASFILLQGTPSGIPLDRIRTNILKIPGIKGIHELHVWQLSDTKIVASAHISVASGEDYMSLAGQVKKVLHNHGVHSATIQPEVVATGNSSAIALPETENGNTKCLLSCSASCEPQLCCPPDQ